MKRILLALMVLAASCSCTFNINVGNGKRVVCKGPEVEQSLDLKDFSSICINGSSDLFLSQADSFCVKIKANEEVFQYLNFHVEDGTLVLENKDNVQIVAKTFKVYVSLPCLENLIVNGSADAQLNNYRSDKELTVKVNGAGDFDLSHISVPAFSVTVNGAGDLEVEDIQTNTVSISVNGAGDVTLSGKTDTANLSVSGAGDIDASELEAREWNTRKTGIASIKTSKKN